MIYLFIIRVEQEHSAEYKQTAGNMLFIEVHSNPVVKTAAKLFFTDVDGSPSNNEKGQK